MSDRLLMVMIASIVAGLTAWLSVPLLSAAARRERNSGGGEAKSWMQRLEPWLAAIPLPVWFIQRRSGPKLTARLQRAGISWEDQRFLAFQWGVFWVGIGVALLIGLATGAWLVRALAVLILVGALTGPSFWLGIRADRRGRAVERELPDFLDRLTLALSAGLGFEVALRRTVDSLGGLLGEELRRCVRYLDWGRTKAEAMAQLSHRNPSQAVRAFVTAVQQAELLGSSLAATLRIQRDLMRARRRRRVQEASRRLPVLIVFPLVFFFLPSLLIIFLAPPLLHLFLGR